MALLDKQKLVVTIGTRVLTDVFEKIEISHSIDEICGYVSLISPDFYEKIHKRWRFNLGDLMTVTLNNRLVFLGYLEEIAIDYSNSNHSFRLTGRDMTSDLIGTGSNLKLEVAGNTLTVANAVLSNYKIVAKIQSGYIYKAKEIIYTEAKKFVYTDIEPIIDGIVRLCDNAGYLPICKGDGFLTLYTGSKKINTDVLTTQKVQSCSFKYNVTDRFSQYIAYSHKSSSKLSVNLDPNAAVSYATQSTPQVDRKMAVKRNRTYTVQAEDDLSVDELNSLAIKERNQRIGQSLVVNYVLDGWVNMTTKQPWYVGDYVAIKDDKLDLRKLMLVQSCRLTQSAGTGKRAELSLVDIVSYNNSFIPQTPKLSGVDSL